MVLEMRRALEDLKKGDSQGYRKLYNAVYEEAYIRSLLIIRKEEQMMDFMKDFFRDLFVAPDEAEDASDLKKWFLQKFYQRLRKHYHRLLEKQEKGVSQQEGVKALFEIPGTFPLLHRIMLVMAFKDDFTAGEISDIFGLGEEKIQTELDKLEKALSALVKDQPEERAAYLSSWKVLLLGASEEVIHTGSDSWVEDMFKDSAATAGILLEQEPKKADDFEYFVADPEPEPEPEPPKPRKKPVPVMEEEPDEDDEDYEDEDDDEEEYDEDEDDDEDDHYDWDMEDGDRRLVILGIVLALIIVAIVGLVAFRLLGKGGKDEESQDPVQAEQELEGEDGDKLIVKGGEEDFGEEEPEPEPEEVPEETPVEEPEPEEPQTLIMKVVPDSMNVRSEPNTSSNVVTTVKAGDELEIVGDPAEEWVQIRCVGQDGKEGYVMSQYLKGTE